MTLPGFAPGCCHGAGNGDPWRTSSSTALQYYGKPCHDCAVWRWGHSSGPLPDPVGMQYSCDLNTASKPASISRHNRRPFEATTQTRLHTY
jgi:hypothetical protein